MSERVDLFVIGAGSGGVRAARIAAGHGARVTIAEQFRYGGTCVIRGCVPKKLLVLASRFADQFALAGSFGWCVGETRFDWPALVRAKEREITRLEGIYRSNLHSAGVETVESRAVLEGPNTVRLLAQDRSVHAERVLIATGGQPFRPAIPGAELAITSDDAFDLPRLPETMTIEGGGFIAVEFACMLQRMGVQVTVVYRGEQILRGFDDDLRAHLADAMRDRGIVIETNTRITAIKRAGRSAERSAESGGVASGDDTSGDDTSDAGGAARRGSGSRSPGYRMTLSDGRTIETGLVMLATGRRPNVAGLGLERAGVQVDEQGAIRVGADSRTTSQSIWAVGDVTNRLALTPIAIREGHAFADTVFGNRPWTCDHGTVPEAVFSTPEIGTVGLTEAEARERHARVEVYRSSFRPMANVLSDSKEKMLMKLVVDAGTDRVLGVHLCGPDAAEMIQLAAIAVKMGATKRQFDQTVALHPTAAEELVTMRTPLR
ncbi:MAG: FAD-dependent oxidoreductase [Burkholderiaceae bacterium]|nr:FAD-dependent oxidoreductase [Burkholderiaceae bacterium]